VLLIAAAVLPTEVFFLEVTSAIDEGCLKIKTLQKFTTKT
jgi:hypothetical protein